MATTASFARDANNVPITQDGLISTDIQTLVGNNTTVAVPIFGVTGTVEVRGLWGVVSSTIGVNNTAAYFRLNDQTAQVAITASSGVTLSGLAVGTAIVKKGLAAAAVTLLDNAAGRVSEPTTLETPFFSPFVVMKKTGAATNIEFLYSTTDAPTTGQLTFYLRWLPVSLDGSITSL